MQATAPAGSATVPAKGAAPAATIEASAVATDLHALVAHLHRYCNTDLLEAVGAIELSLTQIKLLHHLEDCGRELTLKDAAEAVHVSLPAASRMVDDLFRRGYVERHEDRDDRRMKRVSLTAAGRAVVVRLGAARLSGVEQFVQSLDDDERAALQAALSKLLARPDIAACRPQRSRLGAS